MYREYVSRVSPTPRPGETSATPGARARARRGRTLGPCSAPSWRVRLRAAGVRWQPARGDAFVVPGPRPRRPRLRAERHGRRAHGRARRHAVLAFNGTTEWALDSLEATAARVGAARGPAARPCSGTPSSSSSALAGPPAGYAVTVRQRPAGSRHVDVTRGGGVRPGPAGRARAAPPRPPEPPRPQRSSPRSLLDPEHPQRGLLDPGAERRGGAGAGAGRRGTSPAASRGRRSARGRRRRRGTSPPGRRTTSARPAGRCRGRRRPPRRGSRGRRAAARATTDRENAAGWAGSRRG